METLTTDVAQCARLRGNDLYFMCGEYVIYELIVSDYSYNVRIIIREQIKRQIIDNN